jgi:hypothetical protein
MHTVGVDIPFIKRLRSIAVRSLSRMYRPEENLFVFRLRKTENGIIQEGLSRRYTAIALIGLAGESEAVHSQVLSGQSPFDVCNRLKKDILTIDNLGDVSLILWAARAIGYQNRESIWKRLLELYPADRMHPVLEVAWALSALCIDLEAPVGDLRERLSHRLVSSFNASSAVFPHFLGKDGRGLRSHVTCFADMVYPIQALSKYFIISDDKIALETAALAAKRICRLQGPAGQWWWHYDLRTGEVVERYPVYAIHQDSMAPMALIALREAGGPDFTAEVGKGLRWLEHSPELDNDTLVDERNVITWRKVARKEPGKLSRYVQATASRIHPALRAPGMDYLFPPVAVDYEDRPYHLGWFLHAWDRNACIRWGKEA